MIREPLEYAEPPEEPRLGKIVWVISIGLVCIPLELVGLAMLWLGVTGAVEMYRHRPPRADLPIDVFQIVMFLAIGLVCECACVRWIWIAYRRGK